MKAAMIDARQAPAVRRFRIRQDTPLSYLVSGAICGAATGICFLAYGHLSVGNLAMIYLLGVACVATIFGPREAILSSILSVLALNFFFVPPRFTLSVADTEYLVTLAVTLSVALLISSLTQSLRSSVIATEDRERRTETQLKLSRKLSRSRGKREIADILCETVGQLAPCDAALYLLDESNRLTRYSSAEAGFVQEERLVAAQSSDRPLDEDATVGYYPLHATSETLGVLAIRRLSPEPYSRQQKDLLAAFVSQASLALERAFLAKESHRAQLQVESERLKNSLLSSVSHDLRTPLTSILGAASSLLMKDVPEDKKSELASTIYDEADRLNRLVRNLLDMTSLESGGLQLNLEWNSLEELVGSALSRTEQLLSEHKVIVRIAPNVPLLQVDGVLLEQVFVNLLENEARHTPPGTEVTISADVNKGFVRVDISDNGPGFQTGEEERVFEKFQRGQSALGIGTGLGLAISKAILRAHGSQIWARNKAEGGARMVFELKIDAAPAGPDE